VINAESSPPRVLIGYGNGTGSSHLSEWSIGGYMSVSGVFFTTQLGIKEYLSMLGLS
jgi:hypothetical protein